MNELTLLYEIQLFYFENILNSSIFILYLVTLAVDIITGNISALYLRRWNSKTGINGTLRHFALFAVVILLLPMITFTTNLPVIATGILFYIITQYTISIIENISILGFDLNDAFTKYFEFLGKGTEEMKQENKNKKG